MSTAAAQAGAAEDKEMMEGAAAWEQSSGFTRADREHMLLTGRDRNNNELSIYQQRQLLSSSMGQFDWAGQTQILEAVNARSAQMPTGGRTLRNAAMEGARGAGYGIGATEATRYVDGVGGDGRVVQEQDGSYGNFNRQQVFQGFVESASPQSVQNIRGQDYEFAMQMANGATTEQQQNPITGQTETVYVGQTSTAGYDARDRLNASMTAQDRSNVRNRQMQEQLGRRDRPVTPRTPRGAP
jgi:hypothetical protein